MRITVLGKSPAWQDAGGACSGYLVRGARPRVLLDCGGGVFGKLREHVDYTDVDAVVISHLHADHFIDLVPYSYALLLTPRQQPVPVAGHPGTDDPARPRLIVPPGRAADLPHRGRRLGRRGADRAGVRDRGLRPRLDGRDRPADRDLRRGAALHPHPRGQPRSRAAGRFTFGADCRPCEELVEAARDTDLLFVEATLPRPERTGIRGHLTPEEAGDHARRAGAKRVVLTHISDELDAEWAREEGARAFGAPVEVARAGDVYEV